MTQQAAVLQNCNNELVKCIEDLCNKRDALQRDITSEEEEKNKLQNDIRILSERCVSLVLFLYIDLRVQFKGRVVIFKAA
jgi:Sjoegren syndrome nuclear autoantigen 1